MSDVELERRHLTGTLMSCSVTAKTTKMLATNPDSVIKQAKVVISPCVSFMHLILLSMLLASM